MHAWVRAHIHAHTPGLANQAGSYTFTQIQVIRSPVWVLQCVTQRFCAVKEVTRQSQLSTVWFRRVRIARWECVFHSQVLTSRLGQLRARLRLGELESRVTGRLRQQKSHVSLQETGQIFKADTARWTEWLNVEL